MGKSVSVRNDRPTCLAKWNDGVSQISWLHQCWMRNMDEKSVGTTRENSEQLVARPLKSDVFLEASLDGLCSPMSDWLISRLMLRS